MKHLLPKAATFVALLLAVTVCRGDATTADTRPNIIVIMSDDMGYSDIGCYGGEISTPNLDRLAADGLRYTQFYNTGRCCPTRASLLTGLYAHQAGIGQMVHDFGRPGYRGDLSREAVTIAEVLKAAGYSTYMSGKWHVTKHLLPDSEKYNWPLQRGFDRFYGTIIGAGSLFDPWTLTRGNRAITPDNDPQYQPEQYYYTDAISDNAVTFVGDHAGSGKKNPFFLYVSYTAAHWPMHALEKDIAKYQGKYDAGYAAIRKARYERMKKLGVIKDWPLSPAPELWEDIPDEKRAWELRCMEVYAAMVDSMDQGIGRIVASLEENGQLDNTLIFYLQDNGGCAENRGRSPRNDAVEGVVPMGKDELQTRMVPLRTRDGHPVLTGPDVMPGPSATYIAYGRNWANVSNTPFRQYKSKNHEGGIATPLIAHWPKGIRAKNELRDQVGHLIDIMATCVDVAGADYPESCNGHTIQPMEGRSLVPSFHSRETTERLLMWEHYQNCAIRRGKWKLVKLKYKPDQRKERGEWELYDMEKDRSELNDLAKVHPEKAAELETLWTRNAHRTKIFPKPGGKAQRIGKRPNVVILYGDDVGYGDVGVYGSTKIPTPHLDRLAAEGLRFTDGHCSAATCTPSRYSLLTGEMPFRKPGTGIARGNANMVISPDQFTLADVFQQSGYKTAVIGKWHLGLDDEKIDWNRKIEPGPESLGFDHYFIMPATNDRTPCVYMENGHVVNLDPSDPITVSYRGRIPDSVPGTKYPDARLNPESITACKGDGYHSATVLNGLGRIGYMKGGKSALFKDEDMADDFVREAERFLRTNKDAPFFLFFSANDIHCPRWPHQRHRGKSQHGLRGDAMVSFDDSVGQIVRLLDELGLKNDTLIIASSDNGPVYIDGGYQDGCETRGSSGSDRGHDASGIYRGGKYQIYEGGTRVPFIVRCPGRVKPGVSDALVSQVDLLASFAAMLGREVPDGQARDSRNYLKTLLGEESEGAEIILEHARRSTALRRDDWKYIDTPPQLYDLAKDPGETENLVERRPEMAKEMNELLETYRKQPLAE